MDLRVTGQSVAANEVMFDQSVEQAIDTEFTLPDYCPDISRVLKCKVTPSINSRAVSGATLNLEGTVAINLLFADSDNSINSYEYQTPFNRALEVGQGLESGYVQLKVKPDYVNCRAITPRKLDIHGAITMHTKIICRHATEIITDVDSPDIQMRRGNSEATTPMGTSEKHMIIEEELEIGQGQPSIRCLLRSDGRAVSTDCKIISNKAVVKGELLVSILYCPEGENRPQTLESSLPISQIIDIDHVNESCECDVSIDVTSLDIKPRTGMSGEARSFSMCAKLCICVSAYCNAEVPVIYDAFSTKYEADVQKSDIVFEKIVSPIHENYLCKKTLEFSEDAIGTVVDLWCDNQVGNVRTENKQLVINGTVQICILAFDTKNSPVYYERPVDYEYRYDLEKVPSVMRCEPQIVAVASSYTLISSERIEVRVELGITAAVFEISKVPAVTAVEVNESAPKKRQDDTALVIYYTEPGEDVWDIARKYNTSPNEIVNLNELSEETLPGGKMLLIPCM